MPSRTPYDPWRDVDGTHIPVGCRVEQIGVGKLHGAQPSRLHKHGEVTGRGTYRLSVHFDGDDQPVSVRPHLLRVLRIRRGRSLAPVGPPVEEGVPPRNAPDRELPAARPVLTRYPEGS